METDKISGVSPSEYFNKIRNYINLRSSLMKYSVYESIIKALASALNTIITLILVCIMLIFLSLALTVWLKEFFGSYLPGLLIVSGIYALLILFFTIFREKLILNPMVRKIRQFDIEDDGDAAKADIKNIHELQMHRMKLHTRVQQCEHELQDGFKTMLIFFTFDNLKKQIKDYLLELSENILIKAIKHGLEFLTQKFGKKDEAKREEKENTES